MGKHSSTENVLLENSSTHSSSSTDQNDQNLLTQSKRNNSNLLRCRICLEDGNSGELIDPCQCSGTLKLVHTNCLEKWLSISNSNQCEICKYTFLIQRKDKPVYQSLLQWWKATKGWKVIAADFICLIVLTSLCSAASYMCGLGATAYSRIQIWEGFALAVLCCMLLSSYFVWLIIIIRFYFKSWRDWCDLNQDVTLLVKHRDRNESRRIEARLREDQDYSENQFIVMSRVLPWFSTYNYRFDSSNNLRFHINNV